MKPVTNTQLDVLAILRNGDTLQTYSDGRCGFIRANLLVSRKTLDSLIKKHLIKKVGSLGAGQGHYNITSEGISVIRLAENNAHELRQQQRTA